jgi:hypothetical protein
MHLLQDSIELLAHFRQPSESLAGEQTALLPGRPATVVS